VVRERVHTDALVSAAKLVVDEAFLGALGSDAVVVFKDAGVLYALTHAWTAAGYQQRNPTADDFCTDLNTMRQWHDDLKRARNQVTRRWKSFAKSCHVWGFGWEIAHAAVTRRFPSARWHPVPGATPATLGFGICPLCSRAIFCRAVAKPRVTIFATCSSFLGDGGHGARGPLDAQGAAAAARGARVRRDGGAAAGAISPLPVMFTLC
jgi:hypothetical protein